MKIICQSSIVIIPLVLFIMLRGYVKGRKPEEHPYRRMIDANWIYLIFVIFALLGFWLGIKK